MKIFHERILDEATWREWYFRGLDARPTAKIKLSNEQLDGIKSLFEQLRAKYDSEKHQDSGAVPTQRGSRKFLQVQ